MCKNQCLEKLHSDEYVCSPESIFYFFKSRCDLKAVGVTGGLTIPSARTIALVEILDATFLEVFDGLKSERNMKAKLFEILLDKALGECLIFHDLCTSLIESLVDQFLIVRIHAYVRFTNNSLVQKKKKQNRKLLKVSHR